MSSTDGATGKNDEYIKLRVVGQDNSSYLLLLLLLFHLNINV
jgi:hypothetical protein